MPKPAFLEQRRDPWSVADRIVWNGELYQAHPRLAPWLDRLWSQLEPLELPTQVIHGDIGGNMLLSKGLPPAIIDFSPYRRPDAFASAVLVADAVVWERAPIHIAELAPDASYQLVLRAELRRLLEVDLHHRLGSRPEPYLEQIEVHIPFIRALEAAPF